jgi:hypothetical protein
LPETSAEDKLAKLFLDTPNSPDYLFVIVLKVEPSRFYRSQGCPGDRDV